MWRSFRALPSVLPRFPTVPPLVSRTCSSSSIVGSNVSHDPVMHPHPNKIVTKLLSRVDQMMKDEVSLKSALGTSKLEATAVVASQPQDVNVVVVDASNSNKGKKSKSKRVRNPSPAAVAAAAAASAHQPSREQINRVTLSMALSAYCEACREAGELDLAMSKFNNYRIIWRKKFGEGSKFGDLNLYRKVSYLSLVGELGSVEDCAFIWRAMASEGEPVEPDSQCYIYALRCFGREGPGSRERDFADELAESLREKDVNFHALHSEGHFRKSHALELQAGIKIFNKDFVPPTTSQASGTQQRPYECRLLQHLNDRNTSLLSSPLPTIAPGAAHFQELLESQLARERVGYVTLPSVLPVAAARPEVENSLDLMLSLVEQWRTSLTQALSERINGQLRHKADLSEGTMTVYPFFKLLEIEEYVNIVLHEITRLLKMSASFSPSVTSFQKNLGTAVMHQVQLRGITKGDERYHRMFLSLYHDYLNWLSDPGDSAHWCPREAILSLSSSTASEHGHVTFARSDVEWPFPIKLAIGRELLNIIMRNIHVKVDQEGRLVINDRPLQQQPFSELDRTTTANSASSPTSHASTVQRGSCPVFFRVFHTLKDQKEIEMLKPLPSLVKLLSLDKFSQLEFYAKDLPMVVPPLPWTSSSHGGYLLRTCELIRAPAEGGKVESTDAVQKLAPILDALNQLGTTPWKINEPLLELMLEVFTNQKAYSKYLNRLGIPRDQGQLQGPTLDPEIQRKMESERLSKAEVKTYRAFIMQRQAFNQFKRECYAQWCDTLYRLSIANYFKSNVMYFPHNLDFRGRVYPVAPYLNHIGCDLSRSLLVFAEGKRLGPKGLEWLKLHTVNLSGMKKRDSIAERLRFAEEILPDIVDSAADPFGGRQWWLQSDEPWQTLGACFEIKAVLDSGDPENFVSHLPIHQDGSCNGLQHYAALGRDLLGARSVNLLPADKPQDVYSEIAAIVDRKRREDAESGISIAETVEGFVNRKVIKQTVMTTVYGVTKYGAKLQIARQLKDNEVFPLERVEEASKYLAKKTFESLNEMFRASQTIQAWFTECANILSGEMAQNVEWTTPLGLRVVQPYSKRTKTIKPSIVDDMCSVDPFLHINHDMRVFSKPNVLKQKNGFPPNFVHSLDSTHMMLTALQMWNSGGTFASVHDCYWTHAASVELMNRICRDQFVNLHSYPILEELSDGFCQKLEIAAKFTALKPSDCAKAKILFTALPEKGELDLQEVKNSVFFFS